MFEIILYAAGFFFITLLVQYVLYKLRKNKNQGKNAIWVGRSAALSICILGIMEHNVNYLGAVAGFLAADEIGRIWRENR